MKSILFGVNGTAPSTSANQYHYLCASSLSTPSSTESLRQLEMPCAGVLKNLGFTIDVAPGTGKSWEFKLHVNGLSTALTCVISDAATTATDTTHSVAFQPGDLLNWVIIPTGTPTAFALHHWDVECHANGQPILGGNGNTPSTSATNYSVLHGGNPVTWTGTESGVQVVCPTAGTFSNLRVRLSGSPNTSASYTVTVRKSGDTALTTTISGATATAGQDLTHSFTVVAGDLLTIKVAPAGSPAARSVWWSMLFVPTVDGESWFGFGNSAVPSAVSINTEQGIYAGANAWDGTEANRKAYIGPQTLKKVYAHVVTAPGGVASRKFTVRLNAVDTALNPTITGAATDANATADVTFTRSDQFDVRTEPALAPAAATGGVHLGFLAYAAPSYPHRVHIS